MEKNFIVNQSVYIVYDGNYYDLHNNYRLSELLIYPKKSKVILKWIKIDAEWVNKENAKGISLIFKDVTYFQISNNFIKDSIERIEEIGYKEPFDFDLDWLVFEEKFTPSQHIVFRFENDEYIRVQSLSISSVIL